MESWRDIPGYEGLYQASDLGRVRSLGRTEEVANRWGGMTTRVKKPKVMKLGSVNNDDRRYVTVGLHKDGKVVTYEVHRLVTLTFIGPMPGGLCTCHNNGNSKDNRLINLRYDTQLGNIADKRAHGTHVEGEQISWTKLTNEVVRNMRARYASGESAETIAASCGTNASNVRRICRGERFVSAGGPLTQRRKHENQSHQSAQ